MKEILLHLSFISMLYYKDNQRIGGDYREIVYEVELV